MINFFKKSISAMLICIICLSLFGCNKANTETQYAKEDAASTGYGTGIRSAIYIEDFYFLTLGTEKSVVDILLGAAHYNKDNNELLPVYTLANGDNISITYDSEKKTVASAEYTYTEDMESKNFFDILVELEILDSPSQETTQENTTDIPNQQIKDEIITITPSDESVTNSPTQQTTQGDVFASGAYNFTLIESLLQINMPRTNILSVIGKPNYFFSHSFNADSYIIDCYNLNDGSKLYLDYGFERTNLRCAAIYKNGTISTILNVEWSEQQKPNGFTRPVSDVNRVHRLSKNMTPAKVYAYLGEPSWYEGTRGSYSDVYLLSDGSHAYLSFGSAHNKLTSLSIKGADGTVTVISLK